MVKCEKCLFNSENYPNIKLDEAGICDICKVNEKRILALKSVCSIEDLILKIKSKRKGKYDCLIGISGGTDSSYIVYLAKKWGLNPLLMHVDGGWNSETSVINIEKIVDNSGFDFVTEVLPWHEMRDVQYSFIKANVIDIDLPFDNAMLMYNYKVAQKFNIKYVLNGYSTTTEGIMPENFNHYKLDKKNIIDIHRKYGHNPLKRLKFLGSFKYIWYDRIKKIEFLHPLDHIDYNKNEAKKVIQDEFEWKDYGGKHYENIFTRFYQGHILPIKFKVDKRVSHLSMLICSGQLLKDDAMLILEKESMYPSKLLERDDQTFFCKKLKLDALQFESYMKMAPVTHREFKSDLDLYDKLRPAYRLIRKYLGLKIFK
jgi:N-acetyl sugar amidotransferase